jgi:phosphocarrier protein HPr
MIKSVVKIENKSGLHARPASDFVKTALKFKSDIKVIFNGKKINAKSIIEILAGGIKAGSEIELVIRGKDEKEAMVQLSELIESKFGES